MVALLLQLQARRASSADVLFLQSWKRKGLEFLVYAGGAIPMRVGILFFWIGLSLAPIMGAATEPGYREAESLAKEVREGRLPRLESRLPSKPMLVMPVGRPGEYGGTWHVGILGTADVDILYRTAGYEGLVRWDPSGSRVVPNLAESFHADADRRVYTFRLRRGLRWSDGVPFTVDDVLFWYENFFVGHSPTERAWMGEDAVIEKVDDATLVLRLSRPHGLLLEYLATPRASSLTGYPGHYLKRFLPKYNPLAEEEAKRAGFPNAGARFEAESYLFSWRRFYAGLPTLNAWTMMTPLPTNAVEAVAPGTRFVAARNPFYWKIDPEGRQLPYIDRLEFVVGKDVDELIAQTRRGLLEIQYFYVSGEENRADFLKHASVGKYRLVPRPLSISSATALSLNLVHRDPVMRELLGRKEVRVALSTAIDRERIVREVGLGMGRPYQLAPRPESPFYHEALATQFIEYQPQEAGLKLDQAGLAARDAEGWRLRPDQKRLTLEISICSSPYYGELWRRVAEEVARDWRNVNVHATVRLLTRQGLYDLKNLENGHDAVIWEGEGGVDVLLEPRYYVPTNWESNYGIPWCFWLNGDRQRGVKPPEVVENQVQRFREIREKVDLRERQAALKQVLDTAAEQFYAMGIALQSPGYCVVSERVGNFPMVLPSGWSYPSPGPANPCQFYFKEASPGSPTL